MKNNQNQPIDELVGKLVAEHYKFESLEQKVDKILNILTEKKDDEPKEENTPDPLLPLSDISFIKAYLKNLGFKCYRGYSWSYKTTFTGLYLNLYYPQIAPVDHLVATLSVQPIVHPLCYFEDENGGSIKIKTEGDIHKLISDVNSTRIFKLKEYIKLRELITSWYNIFQKEFLNTWSQE